MMPLARFGAVELRLFELAEHRRSDSADFWFELYCRDSRMSLDSCRCQDLEVAEFIANDFIVLARQLNERSCNLRIESARHRPAPPKARGSA